MEVPYRRNPGYYGDLPDKENADQHDVPMKGDSGGVNNIKASPGILAKKRPLGFAPWCSRCKGRRKAIVKGKLKRCPKCKGAGR